MCGKEGSRIESRVIQVRRCWTSLEQVRSNGDETGTGERVRETETVRYAYRAGCWGPGRGRRACSQFVLGKVDPKNIGQIEHRCTICVWCISPRFGDVVCCYSSTSQSNTRISCNVVGPHLLPSTTSSAPTGSPVCATMDVSPSMGRSEALPRVAEARRGAQRRKRVNMVRCVQRACSQLKNQECTKSLGGESSDDTDRQPNHSRSSLQGRRRFYPSTEQTRHFWVICLHKAGRRCATSLKPILLPIPAPVQDYLRPPFGTLRQAGEVVRAMAH